MRHSGRLAKNREEGEYAQKLSIVCLKSFGDLIVARSALRESSIGAELLIGDHLVELNDALGPRTAVRILNHMEGHVPAIYDVRKHGVTKAIRSALRLRRLFRNALDSELRTYVFDKKGVRESFINGGAPILSLPDAENIYVAYRRLFGLLESGNSQGYVGDPTGNSIGIFPGSRLARKILPASTIKALVETCHSHEIEPILYLLEGEEVQDAGSIDVETVIVPRRFSAMAEAVRQVSGVISADSMPAHMTEYFKRPVYVVTPVPNEYWLPLSAYECRFWSCFRDIGSSASTLPMFFAKMRR